MSEQVSLNAENREIEGKSSSRLLKLKSLCKVFPSSLAPISCFKKAFLDV